MDNQKTNPHHAFLDKLKQSKNILVTVSSNPSVDQLAACLGLTLWLNKLDKHATAVFSGEVPSTLEFLQPEATLEKNTDSLRDFIISLDKSKADKLRYKVEDKVVKIFITPYRTSLSADDLEYSQGDFNVDMVIALGVSKQQDLDTAITAHGRILHDATVATITVAEPSELGSINWNDSQASSLSELVAELGTSVDKSKLDGQIATSLLTGIVAETERFSNSKTSPQTMSVSSQLMSAGANQQLVASKLAEPEPEPEPEPVPEPPEPEAPAPEPLPEPPVTNDGTLEITHDDEPEPTPEPWPEPAPEEFAVLPEPQEQVPVPEPEVSDMNTTYPDENTQDNTETPVVEAPETQENPEIPDVPETSEAPEIPEAPETVQSPEPALQTSKFVSEPPSMGGTLTANAVADDITLEPSTDPLSQAQEQPLRGQQSAQEAPQHMQAAPPDWMPAQPWMDPADTLTEIEESVHSPHLDQTAAPEAKLDNARDEVMQAINAVPDSNPGPVEALNAQPIDLQKPPETQAPPVDPELAGPVDQPFTLPLPQGLNVPPANPVPPTSANNDPTAPPPVPPPLMPPGFPPAQ